MVLADGSYWVYQYDNLGQVISGRRYWADGTPVAGQQFEYGFDDIGNRTTTGGRASAESTYTVNDLNQYLDRSVTNRVDVFGVASPTNAVTVAGNPAGRHGEYFHEALTTADNTGGALYTNIVTALAAGGSSATNHAFVPKTPETYTHDADGNLTQDGRWTYVWDGENRLIEMRRDATSPAGAQKKLTFEYDWQGRRVRKTVYQGNGNPTPTWTEQSDTVFLYDGWNLVAELDANASNAKVRTYVWGNDLSGSQQGAGGVGGLLKVVRWTSPTTSTRHFVAYDGNGNVVGLVAATDGSVSARYEFGPFGEPLRASGTQAANPFRFSTKYWDTESGLYYYGHRLYDPPKGRWLSRDPIGELGFDPSASNRKRLRAMENSQTRLQIMAVLEGDQLSGFLKRAAMMNGSSMGSREDWLSEEFDLYAFVHNDPLDQIDADGRVAVLLVFSTGKAISNGILACYDCYQLKKCISRGRATAQQAAEHLNAVQYYNWLKAAQPGKECTPLLAACGKDALMVGVWIGGRYLLLKYYAKGSY